MAEAGSKFLSCDDGGLATPEPEAAGVNGGVCMEDAGGECLGVGRPDCGWLELFEGTCQRLAIAHRMGDVNCLEYPSHFNSMRQRRGWRICILVPNSLN